MEVGADDATGDTALEAVVAVVAVAAHHPAEGPRAGAEAGAPGVVLEADDAHGLAVDVGVDHQVADQPGRPGDGVEVEDPDARHPRAVGAGVAVPGELEAPAHAQRRGAVGDGGAQALGLRGDEVLGDDGLVAVLAAAEVVEVVGAGLDRVADRRGR